MHRFVRVCAVIIIFAAAASTSAFGAGRGEQLFKQHCAVCHPDGGNIITPNKSLKKKDLHANKVRTPADIVKLMRKPGPGMNAFDDKTIPDKDAKMIAEYILGTFK